MQPRWGEYLKKIRWRSSVTSATSPSSFQNMAFALLHLSKAGTMAVLPGYRDAPNCRLEMLLAALYNIPVVYAYSGVPILFDSFTLGVVQSLVQGKTEPACPEFWAN